MKKKTPGNFSRRSFLRDTSIVAGGFMIVPRHVLGKGFIAPSDKLNIAGIGVGGKAEVNLPYAWNNGAENIVALCDVDDRMAVNARKKWPGAPYYKNFREMLEKEHKNIDAVMVTTPDHMHAVHALPCMQLGKHVYVEKPLTHDIYEARILTQAEKKYKVVTQMGNQGSSGDDTRNVETWIQAGVIGLCTLLIFGRIVLYGHQVFLCQQVNMMYLKNWIGIFGWEQLLIVIIILHICRPSGVDGQ